MKSIRPIWFSLLASAAAMAVEPNPAAVSKHEKAAPAAAKAHEGDHKSEKDEGSESTLPNDSGSTMERLFSAYDNESELKQVVEQARKEGVKPQPILEARFLFYVDHAMDDAVAALQPEVLAMKDSFKPEDSEIFATRENWLAVCEYVDALVALKKGDKDGFKKHITEAFWLSPSQGAAFAPHIERMRMDDAMKAVKFDFSTTLKPIMGGDAVSFTKILGDRKALLLQFWSPLNEESDTLLPDFVNVARILETKGVATATIAIDKDEVLKPAREAITKLGKNPSGAWLIDSKAAPLTLSLRATNIPMYVLINAEGKVLYHGLFTDVGLWNEIHKFAPDVKSPDTSEQDEPSVEGE